MNARDELAKWLDRVSATAFLNGARGNELYTAQADALIAEGWRKMPTKPEVIEWVLSNFGVSNGTQVWVEFQGNADGLSEAILALMDGGSA